jgi:hypothetical protein
LESVCSPRIYFCDDEQFRSSETCELFKEMKSMTTSHTLLVFGCVAALASCDSASTSANARQAGNATPTGAAASVTEIRLLVDGTGYQPAAITVPANRPVRLTVVRTADEGCGQQLVFPTLNIRRDLPLNHPVTVEFDMPASGQVDFTCGMSMMRGSIVARAQTPVGAASGIRADR